MNKRTIPKLARRSGGKLHHDFLSFDLFIARQLVIAVTSWLSRNCFRSARRRSDNSDQRTAVSRFMLRPSIPKLLRSESNVRNSETADWIRATCDESFCTRGNRDQQAEDPVKIIQVCEQRSHAAIVRVERPATLGGQKNPQCIIVPALLDSLCCLRTEAANLPAPTKR